MIGRLLGAVLALIAGNGLAAGFDYRLEPVLIAPDTYLVAGAQQNFDFDNGGHIANVAFIDTSAGVVVIDSGPSRRFGEQLRALIRERTGKEVVLLLNTHLHPDHSFGNQAFADVEIGALAGTRSGLERDQHGFADNLYRMVGNWMQGTEPLVPPATVAPGLRVVGDHRLRLIADAGHSAADLVILDETTGVLFAGDLVFSGRAAATPHADLGAWRAALGRLEAIAFRLLVPGHGPVATDSAPIRELSRYLGWLEQTLAQAAGDGRDMVEVMAVAIPPPFDRWALAREELERSVVHLFPAEEERVLERIDR